MFTGAGYSSLEDLNKSKSKKAKANKDLRNEIAHTSSLASNLYSQQSELSKPLINTIIGNPKNPDDPSLAKLFVKKKMMMKIYLQLKINLII